MVSASPAASRSASRSARSGRGGARNTAGRRSYAVKLRDAAELLSAAEHAARIGLPFNLHVTVHWQKGGVTDAAAGAATTRFLKLAGDWLRKRGGAFAYLYARECSDVTGTHVHILMHVPPGLRPGWRRLQLAWLKRVTGRSYRGRVIHSRRIGGTLRAAITGGAHYAANLKAVREYLLKGADAETVATLGLTVVRPGGCIVGKRCGTSENIGQTERARFAKNNRKR